MRLQHILSCIWLSPKTWLDVKLPMHSTHNQFADVKTVEMGFRPVIFGRHPILLDHPSDRMQRIVTFFSLTGDYV